MDCKDERVIGCLDICGKETRHFVWKRSSALRLHFACVCTLYPRFCSDFSGGEVVHRVPGGCLVLVGFPSPTLLRERRNSRRKFVRPQAHRTRNVKTSRWGDSVRLHTLARRRMNASSPPPCSPSLKGQPRVSDLPTRCVAMVGAHSLLPDYLQAPVQTHDHW